LFFVFLLNFGFLLIFLFPCFLVSLFPCFLWFHFAYLILNNVINQCAFNESISFDFINMNFREAFNRYISNGRRTMDYIIGSLEMNFSPKVMLSLWWHFLVLFQIRIEPSHNKSIRHWTFYLRNLAEIWQSIEKSFLWLHIKRFKFLNEGEFHDLWEIIWISCS
jgi:hypothetical protein